MWGTFAHIAEGKNMSHYTMTVSMTASIKAPPVHKQLAQKAATAQD